ncbi:MAG: thermonuclease family protein [Patescibacteria group bacterium]
MWEKFRTILVLATLAVNVLLLIAMVNLVNNRLFDFSKLIQSRQLIEPEVAGEATESEEMLVNMVIDGDTIVLEEGVVVGYIGIDAPPKSSESEECFANEAFQVNRILVEGKSIRLEKDISEGDSDGRLLRYVWVENILVNDFLVREGYARSFSNPPDLKYQQELLQAEREAFEANKGLWEACY